MEEVKIVKISLKKDSKFYKNCKRNRKVWAKICDDCPFREWIEVQEAAWNSTK